MPFITNVSLSYYNYCAIDEDLDTNQRLLRNECQTHAIYNPCNYYDIRLYPKIINESQFGFNPKSQITIKPLNRFEPQISEHRAMDWSDLIYNIGGTIGMWIGVSMLTIPNMITLSISIIAKLVSLIFKQLKIKFYSK